MDAVTRPHPSLRSRETRLKEQLTGVHQRLLRRVLQVREGSRGSGGCIRLLAIPGISHPTLTAC